MKIFFTIGVLFLATNAFACHNFQGNYVDQSTQKEFVINQVGCESLNTVTDGVEADFSTQSLTAQFGQPTSDGFELGTYKCSVTAKFIGDTYTIDCELTYITHSVHPDQDPIRVTFVFAEQDVYPVTGIGDGIVTMTENIYTTDGKLHPGWVDTYVRTSK